MPDDKRIRRKPASIQREADDASVAPNPLDGLVAKPSRESAALGLHRLSKPLPRSKRKGSGAPEGHFDVHAAAAKNEARKNEEQRKLKAALAERGFPSVSSKNKSSGLDTVGRVCAELKKAFVEQARINRLDEQACAQVIDLLADIEPSEVAPDAMGAERNTVELPDRAPLLWENRHTLPRMNPTAFVRYVYGPWLNSLSRGALHALDKPLYHAYANWVSRHPEDNIEELVSQTTETEALLQRLRKVATEDEIRRAGLALQMRAQRLSK